MVKKVAKKSKVSLKSKARTSVSVTKGTKNNQEVLKEGVPLQSGARQKDIDNVVGVSIGVTKNMDNYESLRVECWLTDTIAEGETPQQAYNRIIGIVDEVLTETVESYI